MGQISELGLSIIAGLGGAHSGELAALSAALLWAIAASIFARLGDRVAPLVMNLTKGFVAIALLLLTLLLLQRPFPLVEPKAIAFLMLSGAIGIGLGDTFYFRSLTLIGARRSLLIESLAPPLAAVLALLFLGETLSLPNIAGIILTLGGVIWVVSERMTRPNDSPTEGEKQQHRQHQPGQHQSKSEISGSIYALLAALGQAGGAVLSRAGLTDTAMDPLWSTLLRLVAGLGLLLLWIPLAKLVPQIAAPQSSQPNPANPSVPNAPSKFIGFRLLGIIAITAFFSTYLAIWLQQTALKYSPAGIAQALTSTSPLFILPIAIALGEKLSARAVLGVVIALSGIILLFQ